MIWEEIFSPFLEVAVSIYRKIQCPAGIKRIFLKKRNIPRLAQGYRDEKGFSPTIYTLTGA